VLLSAVLSAALALSGPQKSDPATCPWCEGDAERMRAAGVVSHGPVPIATAGSEALARELGGPRWIFLETAHLRWASSLGAIQLDPTERARLADDLARLRELLPSMPESPRKLDPWLRLHLLALRAERLYARFQELCGVSDADFPAERGPGPFMGIGPYLGEKDKFEVVLHERVATHRAFTKSFSGVEVENALRWHFNGLHKLIVSVPLEDGELRKDRALWAHLAHNLGHALLAAYKHFSYDPPLWVDEGLAFWFEKEADPGSTTLDGEEGTRSSDHGPRDWEAGVVALVRAGKAPTLARLMAAKSAEELDIEAKMTSWSIVRWMIETHGEPFGRFLGGIKGQLDAEGVPTGANLLDLQRSLFSEHFRMAPPEVDEAWKSFVLR